MRPIIFSIALPLAGFLSCTDKQNSSIPPAASETSGNSSTSPGSNNVVISGTLAIGEVPASTQGSGISLGSREVNIVDGSGNVIASSKTASDGSYAVIAPGVLMIDSESLALTDTSAKLESIISNTEDGAVIGVQKGLAEFDISGGAMKVGRSELKKITALRGKAMLDGARDHTGILVYVPGTSYQARTDSAGQFLMTFIPAGNYDLRFEKDGYIPSTLSGAIVTENETTQIDQRTLKLSGGATDITVRQVGIQGLSKTRTVSFEITPGTADRFKGGLQADIETAAYAAVPSIFNYTFNADGLFTLKLMFANADGFETTVERTILVDSASPSSNGLRLVDRTTLNNNFTNERFVIAYHDTCADIQALAILPATVASPSSADFIYNCYTTYSNAAQFVLPAGVSSYSYKIWARDQVGNISATSSPGTIDFDNTPPSPASVILADQTLTGNVRFDGTDQTTVDVDVTSCTDTAFLLLSETQSLPPEPSQFSIPCVVGFSRFTFTFANNISGVKSIFAWSMDQAGNVSRTATIKTITLDQTKPVAPAFSLSDPTPTTTGYSNSLLLVANIAHCNEITHVFIRENQLMPPSENAVGWVSCASVVTGIQGLTEGLKTFYLWARDAGGNISLTAATADITIDITLPTPVNSRIYDTSNLHPDDKYAFTNNPFVYLEVNCGDSSGVFVTESSGYIPTSQDTFQPCFQQLSSFFSSSIEGERALYIWGRDIAGNITASATSDTIKLDLTPPDLPTFFAVKDSSTGSTAFTNETSLSVETTGCEQDSSVFIAESMWGIWSPSESDYFRPCGTSISILLSSYQQGNLPIVLWAKDRAGNVNAAYLSTSINFDSIPPPMSTVTLQDAAGFGEANVQPSGKSYSSQRNVRVTLGSCLEYDKILITLSPSASENEILTSCVSSPSYFEIPLADFDAEQTVFVYAKDVAGNITRMSSNITLDRIPPMINVGSLKVSEFNTNSVNLAWSTGPDDSIFTRLDWGVFGESNVNHFVGVTSTVNHILNIAPEPPISTSLISDTKYTFSARAVDHALNEGIHQSVDITTPSIYRLISGDGAALGKANSFSNFESRRRIETCDINADGYDDIFIGSPEEGDNNSGIIYVIYGNPSSIAATPRDPKATADITIRGSYQAKIGLSMKCAHVAGSSGKQMLILGANWLGSARIWILQSSASYTSAIDLGVTDPSWPEVQGTVLASGQYSMAAGDVNGDQFDDFILCSTGNGSNSRCEGWLGGSALGGSDFVTSDFSLDGSQIGYSLGRSVTIGDVNGDGYGDIIVGGHYGGSRELGAVHIFKGLASPSDVIQRKWSLLGPEDNLIDMALVRSGDLDNDGKSDIVITRSGNIQNGANIAIIFGRSDAEWDMLIPPTNPVPELQLTLGDVMLKASAPSPSSSGAGTLGFLEIGDANGDGKIDMIVGAPKYNPRNGDESGITCIFENRSRAAWLNLGSFRDYFASSIANADLCVFGSSPGALSGQSVSLGNFMGAVSDGNKPELIIAEPYFDRSISGATMNHGNISVIKFSTPASVLKPLIFDLAPHYRKE